MRKRPAANRESEDLELVPKYKRPAMSLRHGAFECLDTNRSSFETQCTPSTQGATTSRKRGSTPPRGKPGEKAQRCEQKTKLEAHACGHCSREPSVTTASSDPSVPSSGAFEFSQGAETTASKLENLYLVASRTAPTQEQSILLSAKAHKCRPRQNTRKKTEEQRDINTAATLLQQRTRAKTLTRDTQAYLEALDQVSPKKRAGRKRSAAQDLVATPARSVRYGASELLVLNRSSSEIHSAPSFSLSTRGATGSRKRSSTSLRDKACEKAQKRKQKTKPEADAYEHVSREPSATRASSDPSASPSGVFESSQGAGTTASKLENLYLIANLTAPTEEQRILLSAKKHKCRPRQYSRKKTEEQKMINNAAQRLQKRIAENTLTAETETYLEALDQVAPKKKAGRKRFAAQDLVAVDDVNQLYNEAMNGATEVDVELLRKLKALGHYPHDLATTPLNERAMASQARRRQKSNKSSDVNIKAYLVALRKQTTKNRSSSQADALIREVQTFIQAHSRMPVERPTTAGKRRTGCEPSVEAQDGEERGESSTADVRATYENKLARRWHRGAKKTGFFSAEQLDMLVELDPC